MFLRTLSLQGYGIFNEATFDLTTDVDHPIILVTGNNGAGKTSVLEGLRLALHGKRAFDVPLGEQEYLRAMGSRFHSGVDVRRASVNLTFDYVDLHKTRRVVVKRGWSRKRDNIVEDLHVSLDERLLTAEDAEDLLGTIVPPEIARYFFFDGERIRELAEWDADDETALFSAVGDLLGLGILEQLRRDLVRLSTTEGPAARIGSDAPSLLDKAEERERALLLTLKEAKVQTRRLRVAFDRARAEVRRVGALRSEEIADLEAELASRGAERLALLDEAQRAAGDVLPLLFACTLRKRFGAEIESRKAIEDRAIVSHFLEAHAGEITAEIRRAGLRAPAAAKAALKAIATIARGTLMPVSDVALPSLSRSDTFWMQRVLEHDLPEMDRRTATMVERLRSLDDRIAILVERRKAVPVNDPAGEAALVHFEARQRALIEHEAAVAANEAQLAEARDMLEAARTASKEQRLKRFREGKQIVREQSAAAVLKALPALTERLQSSKELRFAHYLKSALHELWHKTDRLVGVNVSFANRRIALLGAYGEISKRDLSAGEKQLFAIAFIYALSKLSSRHMPFVIDTPLGRLDTEHRRRFVADFIPNASHQVILLSTDTEIVGQLYRDIQPLLAHHYELSKFNGGATLPVSVSA